MGLALLDNLMKVFSGRSVYTGATLVSLELDFDIPRGFVIKIHEASFTMEQRHRDFAGISVDKTMEYLMCLIRDPDDLTTVVIPSNVVDHDVIMAHETAVLITAGTAGDTVAVFEEKEKIRNFSAEGLDVITARNLRFNIDALGADAADATEAIGIVIIHYTYEKIRDEDILALLDIL